VTDMLELCSYHSVTNYETLWIYSCQPIIM